MAARPSIRRARTESGDLADGWVVTWPGFGFASAPSSTTYPTWRAAVAALRAIGLASSGAQVSLASWDLYRTAHGRGYWPTSPRWVSREDGCR